MTDPFDILPDTHNFRIAAQELREKLQNIDRSVPFTRPTQNDVPAGIAAQLTVTEATLTWRGLLRPGHPANLQAFQEKAHPQDTRFREIVQAIIDELNDRKQTFMSPIPHRPHTNDIPIPLQDKLLIGRAVASYHGIMDEAETEALLKTANLGTVDKGALRRLYAKTVRRGLRQSGLQIGVRRGSAPIPPDDQRGDIAVRLLDE
jgi:hypothetical protein